MYPAETDIRLCDVLETGSEVEVDMEKDELTDLSSGKKYSLKPLGDVGLRLDKFYCFHTVSVPLTH